MKKTFIFTIYLTVSFLWLKFPANANHTNNRWFELLNKYNFDKKNHTYCFSGKKNHDFNGTKTIVPASVSKVYSTLFFVNELGPTHRTTIQVYLKDNDLYLENTSDFYFVSERVFFLLNKLNQLGYSQFNNIYINDNFPFNWKTNNLSLKQYLSPHSWDDKIKAEFQRYSDKIFKRKLIIPITTPTITFKELKVTTRFPKSALIMKVQSSPLYKELKSINMYSNNFYHDNKVQSFSNMKEFNKFFHTMLKTNASKFFFLTASGLENNLSTCEQSLNTLRQLDLSLKRNQLTLQDILPIAGENGTMKNRFKKVRPAQSIVGKTGTFPRQQVSSFVGKMNSTDNEYFGIFNSQVRVDKARQFQDELVKNITLDNKADSYEIQDLDFFPVQDLIIEIF